LIAAIAASLFSFFFQPGAFKTDNNKQLISQIHLQIDVTFNLARVLTLRESVAGKIRRARTVRLIDAVVN
jgi:hypothetical protein